MDPQGPRYCKGHDPRARDTAKDTTPGPECRDGAAGAGAFPPWPCSCIPLHSAYQLPAPRRPPAWVPPQSAPPAPPPAAARPPCAPRGAGAAAGAPRRASSAARRRRRCCRPRPRPAAPPRSLGPARKRPSQDTQLGQRYFMLLVCRPTHEPPAAAGLWVLLDDLLSFSLQLSWLLPASRCQACCGLRGPVR
jgi:hypothetical protein